MQNWPLYKFTLPWPHSPPVTPYVFVSKKKNVNCVHLINRTQCVRCTLDVCVATKATHKCLLICYTMHFANTHLYVWQLFTSCILFLFSFSFFHFRLLRLLVSCRFATSVLLRCPSKTAYIGHFRSIRYDTILTLHTSKRIVF